MPKYPSFIGSGGMPSAGASYKYNSYFRRLVGHADERKNSRSADRREWRRVTEVIRKSRFRPVETAVFKAKARQASKIGELKSTLIDAGLIALDEQARALGLSRTTAWSILTNAHKGSGISARIVIRMLTAPDLPPLVRSKIIECVLEKIDGAYGHSIKRSREFASRIALAPTKEGARAAEEIERVKDSRSLRLKVDHLNNL